ncbi:MAG: hypothetical protein ACLGSD_11585 [Acidobacteriota bacterium]
MKTWERVLFARQIACCLVLSVAAAQLSYGAQQPAGWSAQQNSKTVQVAENTGVGAPLPEAPTPQQQAPAPQNQQDNGQKPAGTAVAPVTHPAGIAGSSPSGAAIAPAKQRRVRRIMIRLGIVLGAAAAVGTVAALSHASSSRP